MPGLATFGLGSFEDAEDDFPLLVPEPPTPPTPPYDNAPGLEHDAEANDDPPVWGPEFPA
jgi:hypothetical protein